MSSNDLLRFKLSTHSGVEVVNPSDTEILEAIRDLSAGNTYVLLERFDDRSRPWAAGFVQTSPLEDGAWVLEYREGAEQFQVRVRERRVVDDVLLGYANSHAGWEDNLAWELLMTHDT